MVQYKLVNDSMGNLGSITIVGTTMSIPFCEANTDYAAYLKWLEAGNTPQPADEVTK